MDNSNTTHKQSLAVIMLRNFLRGGIAGCIATTIVIPTDVVKTKMQFMGEAGIRNPLIKNAINSVYTQRGLLGFYTGLDASLMRQFTFASIRIGLCFGLNELIESKIKRPLTFVARSFTSMLMGALGALAINPFDTVLVRMWADLQLPQEQRRNYKNIFNGLSRVCKDDGLLALWRGCAPNVLRAIAVNVGMLVPYMECKERLSKVIKNENALYVVSSIVAGGCASVISLPFDNAKVKLQKMAKLKNGAMPYKGFVDCVMKTIKNEGFLKLWTGFIIFSLNLGPHSMITLLSAEAIRKHIHL